MVMAGNLQVPTLRYNRISLKFERRAEALNLNAERRRHRP